MMFLAAYLDRIGVDAPPLPTIAGLSALHRAHVGAIPFENLDVLLGRSPSLAVPDIAAKLVERRRGGYCFEHTTLFKAVLERIGVPATLLLARVRLGKDSIRPRTHAVLRVDLDGRPFLMDVGFAAVGLAAPLRLDAGVERSDGLMSHRLMKTADLWTLQARINGTWMDLYAFTLEPHHPVDLEMANHYTATYPDSPFRHHLSVSRIGASRRVMLHGHTLSVLSAAGWEKRELAGSAEVVEVLAQEFGLAPPDGMAEWLTGHFA